MKSEELINEYDQAVRLLVKKEVELSRANNKYEQIIKEYEGVAKLLVRKDMALSRANQRLQEIDKLKSNFISIVAHQLRTPLSGIKWTLSILLKGEMGKLNNEQKTFLMKTYESNDRMITLINDMLNIDRLQSGKVHYKFQYINIIDLLDNILYEVNPQIIKKNITIEFKNKPNSLPKVYVDPETMRAALQNVLDNAIKYTTKKGKIVIDIHATNDFLEVSITDNGIGIPMEEQKGIFNRFFRASNAIKYLTDGSGLGLYITKHIVERNGGKIWFQSEVGKGTSVFFTIPINERDLQRL